MLTLLLVIAIAVIIFWIRKMGPDAEPPGSYYFLLFATMFGMILEVMLIFDLGYSTVYDDLIKESSQKAETLNLILKDELEDYANKNDIILPEPSENLSYAEFVEFYPELKNDANIKQQAEQYNLYVKNIENYKNEQKSIPRMKWLLYFGK